jgi:elongation factor Ts
MMDCKRALEGADGNLEQAITILRQQGAAQASKKSQRTAKEGIILSYIHPGDRLGVMLEINCETDFVARTEDFRQLAKDLAMQIAATNPVVVSRSDLTSEQIEKEETIYRNQALNEKKPEKIIDKIISGKMEKFYQEVVLLEQPFIKDQEQTIQNLLTEAIAKLGENLVLKRFARFRVGE